MPEPQRPVGEGPHMACYHRKWYVPSPPLSEARRCMSFDQWPNASDRSDRTLWVVTPFPSRPVAAPINQFWATCESSDPCPQRPEANDQWQPVQL